MAEGKTTVDGAIHVQRGYEDFDRGLRSLGGIIDTESKDKKKIKDESLA
jgi:UDP-N-acetylglucosamine enolpyruvyl transferase